MIYRIEALIREEKMQEAIELVRDRRAFSIVGAEAIDPGSGNPQYAPVVFGMTGDRSRWMRLDLWTREFEARFPNGSKIFARELLDELREIAEEYSIVSPSGEIVDRWEGAEK